jgi:DNA polymerase I-like protein with 3'-5' exonuclease and polymerase domains
LEIHDSLLADVPKDEISKFLKIAKKVMTKKLLYTWKWVSIPLDIEVEISATNWYDKAGADINRLMKGGFNAANI